MRSVAANPASLAEKVRNMGIKREQQAANTANPIIAQELSTTAKSYRALAEALSKSPEIPLDKVAGAPTANLEIKAG